MDVRKSANFQTRTRQVFRLRSFLATLHREVNTMGTKTTIGVSAFRIVTGSENHTGVAIFNYAGHAVHVTPNYDGVSSSINVFELNTIGVLNTPSVFGPVSATLENLGIVRNWIDGKNALPTLDDDDPTGPFPTILDDDSKLLPLPAYEADRDDGDD